KSDKHGNSTVRIAAKLVGNLCVTAEARIACRDKFFTKRLRVYRRLIIKSGIYRFIVHNHHWSYVSLELCYEFCQRLAVGPQIFRHSRQPKYEVVQSAFDIAKIWLKLQPWVWKESDRVLFGYTVRLWNE